LAAIPLCAATVTTPNIANVVANQIVTGDISTPYSVDEWNFAATAGEQIRFHIVNISGTGIGFNLTGPNGPFGFTNLTTDSSFITLPTSGNYTITAHSLNGAGHRQRASGKNERLLVLNAVHRVRPGGMCDGDARSCTDDGSIVGSRQSAYAPISDRIPIAVSTHPCNGCGIKVNRAAHCANGKPSH
jgi:hypothetical protein